MPDNLLRPEEVDRLFRWPPGRANRLARRGKLPCLVMPDGAFRFNQDELQALVRHVSPTPPDAPSTTGEVRR